MKLNSYINRIAQIILAEGDYQYIHDPDHRNKPHGKFWQTDKGWSNDPKDAPQQQTGAYPYKLTPMDNEYFEAIKGGNTEALSNMVSKRAKEAGYEPKELLHGTPSKEGIKVFDKSMSGGNGEWGAFFFTDNPSLAERFAHEQIPSKHSDLFVKLGERGTVMKVFLQMKKPLDLRNVDENTAKIISKMCEDDRNWSPSVAEIMKSATYKNKDIIKSYLPNTNLSKLANYGYDGYIANINESDGGGLEYVVLDPERIKSADPIVKDDKGNIIPLSQRFNPKSNDIRY